MEPLRVVLCGIGGMGGRHLRNLLERDDYRVVAAAEVDFEREDTRENRALAEQAAVSILTDYREMFEKAKADAAFIATPHPLHEPMTIAALETGLDVFCEKPPAPTVAGCRRMLEAQERTGRLVAIGYHHVGHANARWLKHYIAGGALGAISEVVAIMPNFRPETYYDRAPWVGKMKVDGRWCLDGVLMNQMSHFINQSLLFASTEPFPQVAGVAGGTTRSALYRAHRNPALEMDDIGVFGCLLEGGARFSCAATTALEGGGRLTLEILGEKGRALYDGRALLWPNGHEPFVHDEPDQEGYLYENFLQVVRSGASPLSPLAEAAKSVGVLEAVFKAADYQIRQIEWAQTAGLDRVLFGCAQYRCLPAELPQAPAWA